MQVNVLIVPGRKNRSGSPSECLRATRFELTLNLQGIVGPNLPTREHEAGIKLVAFPDKAAHEAGYSHDPAAAEELFVPLSGSPELAALFETAFAAVLPVVAARLGATVETATVPDPPAAVEDPA